jgi:fatty acid desaturase
MTPRDERDEASRDIKLRQQARQVESLPRLAVTLFYVALLVWLAVLLHGVRAGESYSPMRSGSVMVTTGAALWVQCLAPFFFMAAIFFRLDTASLGVRSRRAWFVIFFFLGAMTYVLAPHVFGKVTFLH